MNIIHRQIPACTAWIPAGYLEFECLVSRRIKGYVSGVYLLIAPRIGLISVKLSSVWIPLDIQLEYGPPRMSLCFEFYIVFSCSGDIHGILNKLPYRCQICAVPLSAACRAIIYADHASSIGGCRCQCFSLIFDGLPRHYDSQGGNLVVRLRSQRRRVLIENPFAACEAPILECLHKTALVYFQGGYAVVAQSCRQQHP